MQYKFKTYFVHVQYKNSTNVYYRLKAILIQPQYILVHFRYFFSVSLVYFQHSCSTFYYNFSTYYNFYKYELISLQINKIDRAINCGLFTHSFVGHSDGDNFHTLDFSTIMLVFVSCDCHLLLTFYHPNQSIFILTYYKEVKKSIKQQRKSMENYGKSK